MRIITLQQNGKPDFVVKTFENELQGLYDWRSDSTLLRNTFIVLNSATRKKASFQNAQKYKKNENKI